MCATRLSSSDAAVQEAMPAGGKSTRFDSLAAHFGELGISGQGLETAAQGMPLVGPVIGVTSTHPVLKTSHMHAPADADGSAAPARTAGPSGKPQRIRSSAYKASYALEALVVP